jgi:uncharacterized protein YegL
MRRLPIFFVLDVSESMVGENLRQMSQGMEALVKTLRTDPHALESVYLSTIVFAGKALVLTPLVELASFYPPRLPVGSGTSIGAALTAVMNQIDLCVVKGNAEVKGDWKPIVYLFTDGKPTDDAAAAIHRWKRDYASKASLVAVGIGPYASLSVLSSMTEEAFHLKNERQEDFLAFVKWLSQSVSSQSQSVAAVEKGAGVSLAKFDDSVLQKIKNITQATILDEDFVILTGKCESKKLPYVMRYRRLPESIASTSDFRASAQSYELEGVFPLENDYFELTDERPSVQAISTDALIGAPGCPHCGAGIGFAMCACGGLHCLKGSEATCPWCNSKANYGMSEEGGFDVTRSRG